MKTLVLRVELRGENINVDLDSPLIALVKQVLGDETAPEGVSTVEVRFQFSEESID